MSRTASDRNLLFGILAVQMDFVAADQLIAAMNRWVLDKSKPLGRHLEDLGVLSTDTHKLLAALVDKHIEKHGGSADASLAALPPAEPLREELAQIADADVQTSLVRAAGPTPHGDRYETIAMPRPRDLQAGERFSILRPHASGGLGKVSIARDGELNREVALKELHDRLADNPDSRARFLQEAEITGGLEHPGIVPIYGLGRYADGRPFYAMRFIRGESLASAIERFHKQADPHWSRTADVLQLRRLLARMIDVCNAIEYAHSRGVLHRDLKPSNVMLGAYGETLVVDWGLAKALGKPGAEPTPRSELSIAMIPEAALTPQSGSGSAPTMMGSALGTPAYMSPEQAAGRLDRVGPTSDVFSLGATLYVILTGRAPQGDDDLGVVLERVIRGEFPQPREIKPAVPKALEAICLKAMALDPNDRYASARLLAEDLEAWLGDEPTSALPDSVVSRTWRWVKRHRTLVTTAAATVAVTALASLFGVGFLSAANQREREAAEEAFAARAVAEKAQREAERQVARNDELLAFSRKSLERFEELSRSPQLERFNLAALRGDLQEASIQYYDTLAKQAGESEEARADRAEAMRRLGYTYSQLNQMDKATARLQEALPLFQKLEQEFPANAAYRRGTAETFALMAEILIDSQQTAAAAQPSAEARKRFAELCRGDGGTAADAMALAQASLVEGERLRQLGKMPDAATTFDEAIDALRKAAAKPGVSEGDRIDVRYRLGRALNQLATLESQALWRFDEATKHYLEGKEILTEVYAQRPKFTDTGFGIAQIETNLGYVAARQNMIEEARGHYEQALAMMNDLETRVPDVPAYRVQTAELLYDLGGLQHPVARMVKTGTDLARLEQAVEIGRQLVELYPQQPEYLKSLIRYESSLASEYFAHDRAEDAKKLFSTTLDRLSKLVESTGASVDTLYSLAGLQSSIGEQLRNAGQPAEALDLMNQAEQRYLQLIEMAPNFGEAHLQLSNLYYERTLTHEALGLLVAAVADLDRNAAKSVEAAAMTQRGDMKAYTSAGVGAGKMIRWDYLNRIRAGSIQQIADAGAYDAVIGEAQLLPRLTGEASDHYVAAVALAYGAKSAAASKSLDEAARRKTVEALASAAVAQLTDAWTEGYLTREQGSMFSLFSSTMTLDAVRKAKELAPLRDRADFKALLQRIETEEPPHKPAAEAAKPDAEGAANAEKSSDSAGS